MIRLIAILLCLGPPALAGPLDDALRDTRPCENFPAFDRTDRLSLTSADISLRRDVITVRAEGDITCTASGSGFLRGNVSARIQLNATLDSATCQTKESDVVLKNIGGSAGPIFSGQSDEAQKLLSFVFQKAIEAECRRNLGSYLN